MWELRIIENIDNSIKPNTILQKLQDCIRKVDSISKLAASNKEIPKKRYLENELI